MNGKRDNERSVSDAWMHVYALQAGAEAQTSKEPRKNYENPSKSLPREVPEAPKSSPNEVPEASWSDLGARTSFCTFSGPSLASS